MLLGTSVCTGQQCSAAATLLPPLSRLSFVPGSFASLRTLRLMAGLLSRTTILRQSTRSGHNSRYVPYHRRKAPHAPRNRRADSFHDATEHPNQAREELNHHVHHMFCRLCVSRISYPDAARMPQGGPGWAQCGRCDVRGAGPRPSDHVRS